MSFRVLFTLLSLPFLCAFAANATAQVTVAQDGHGEFNGADEKPILAAIAKVRAAGGGEIVIQPGVYVLQRGLELKDLRNVTFHGQPGATLKLLPLQHAETSADTAVGETALPVSKQQALTPGLRLQIMARGEMDSFIGKQKPTFMAKLVKVEGDRLILAEPLPFPVPAKTQIMNEDAPNLFEFRTGCENIVIEGLTLDGGRTPDDPAVGTHAQRCAIFASGPYNYTQGPTGKPVQHLVIRDCTIRNCFGRGVALYAVTDALVTNCTIEETCDEAVDLDHFTVAARILNNQIAHCRVGVELNDANECWVTGNRFESCEIGVNVWRWCKMEDLNVRNQILDNLFLNTVGNGLQLDGGTRLNFVRGNIIRGSGRNGISLSGHESIVSENIIEHSSLNGIALAGNRNEVARNQISDSGAGAKQKFAGLLVRGQHNRVLDNAVRAGAGADAPLEPVADEGEGNSVRMP